MSIDKLKTKFSTGAWLTDVKHYFSKINEIIDYLNNLVIPDAPSYKIYRAILSQSGTSAPVAIVLENTLGGIITWSRNGVGDYKGTCNVTGIFSDVTKCTFQPPVYDSDPSNNYSPFYNGGWYDADSVYLITSIVDYTTATSARADGILYSNRMMFVEIRVYN